MLPLLVGSRFAGPEPLERFEYRQVHMGVVARIVVYAAGQARAEEAVRGAFRRIAALDDIMSDYRPTSELMRLSAASGGPPVPVSEDLYRVLERALSIGRQSGGAFDVTAGPVVKLWREARRAGRLPDPAELAAAVGRAGLEGVRLDPAHRTVHLLHPGMSLDLGGIAKGYAADEALAVLKQHGLDRALVELGGDIVVGAPPPGREGWRITVRDAAPEGTREVLRHAAISSSGDTEQYLEVGGLRYSHVVDPRTGLGLTDRIAVTVVAPSGTLSDALATAVSVLGSRAGPALLASHYPEVRVHLRHAAPE